MAVTYPDDPVKTLLDQFMAILTVMLSGTVGGVPDHLAIPPGNVATRDVQEQAWVRDAGEYLTTRVEGQPDILPTSMARPLRWYMDIEVGVTRCIASVDAEGGTGEVPDAATITADNARILSDKQALRGFWRLMDREMVRAAKFGQIVNLPNEGGSGGCSMTISVWFADCAPQIEED